MGNNEEKKPIYKKWWFWVIIVVLVIGMFGNSTDTTNTTNNATNDVIENTENNSEENTEVYTIESEKIGEYGKEVVLNKNTDSPTTKYLYKLPSGTYKVTTTSSATVGMFVVKDEITTEEGEYPEVLEYVSEQYVISGNSSRIGKANIKESVEITIKEDESVSLSGEGTVTFEKE